MNIYEGYKFCQLCGGEVLGEKNIRKCKSCGKTRFINPSPATGAIIIKDNKFLLTKRAFEPEKGTWDIPGGFTQTGETLEQSVAREILEELGVETESVTYFNSVFDKYAFQGVEDHLVVVNFVLTLKSYEFTPSDDISEAVFFGPEEVPYEHIKFPSVVATIKQFFELS